MEYDKWNTTSGVCIPYCFWQVEYCLFCISMLSGGYFDKWNMHSLDLCGVEAWNIHSLLFLTGGICYLLTCAGVEPHVQLFHISKTTRGQTRLTIITLYIYICIYIMNIIIITIIILIIIIIIIIIIIDGTRQRRTGATALRAARLRRRVLFDFYGIGQPTAKTSKTNKTAKTSKTNKIGLRP